VTSSDAAASWASRREGASSTSRSADDDTKPHVIPVGEGPAGSGNSENTVKLAKTDSSASSGPPERQPAWAEALDADEPSRPERAAQTNAYASAPVYSPGTSSVAGSYAPPIPPAAQPVHTPPPSAPPRGGGMARRARLKISHLGPLSVMRISLTFALCMFIVLLVAVAALWAVLDTSGVFKSIADAANTLTDKSNAGINHWLTFSRVMLITVVVGAANVIAFTLLSTIGALLYNLCSDFVGGVEVTLVER
jgi:Transmembrane domain of unknown function (DUF3566)